MNGFNSASLLAEELPFARAFNSGSKSKALAKDLRQRFLKHFWRELVSQAANNQGNGGSGTRVKGEGVPGGTRRSKPQFG